MTVFIFHMLFSAWLWCEFVPTVLINGWGNIIMSLHTGIHVIMIWCFDAQLSSHKTLGNLEKIGKVDGTFMQLASILKLETLVPIFKWLKKLKQCDIWTVLPLWTYLKKSTRTLLHLTLAVCEKSRRDKSKSYSYIFIFHCNQWLISLSIVTLKATGATGSCYVTQTLRRIDNEWRSLSDTAV